MRIESIDSNVLAIPFKVAFKHASAERNRMQSLWVEARAAGGVTGAGEGCPREYVTGESLATAREFVEAHRGEWMKTVSDLRTLADWVDGHGALIDANPAAWSAVELALLDCLGKESGRSLEALLGLPPLGGRYRYTAVIGDGSAAAFAAQLAAYRAAGFGEYKIKLSGDAARDREKVRALAGAGISPRSVRADANNLWRDAKSAIEHLGGLGFAFFAIEEPLAAGDLAGMREMARALDAKMILDESLLREEQLAGLADDPGRWIVNLRISKMGGMLRSVRFAQSARERGIALIVGAHVGETSVLTRAGLAIATFARDVLVAQEGAFGTRLLERDPVTPCLAFGAGGLLDLPASLAAAPGLGLEKVVSGTT